MDKKSLRRQIKLQKQAMTQAQIESKSTELARQFLATESYRNARTVYGYLPFNQEVRTQPILEQALREGKRVAIPKVLGREMKFFYIQNFSGLTVSSFGVPEPADDAPVAEDKTALVLMPGLAFDPLGRRIGYGGGYYDRFLAAEPEHPTIALCFDFQLLPALETEEHDIRADRVLWA